MKILYLGIITLLLSSCGVKTKGSEDRTNYEFWDISKFEMDENALENNEEIKLIYTSQGPGNI